MELGKLAHNFSLKHIALFICLIICLAGCKTGKAEPPLSQQQIQSFKDTLAQEAPPADTGYQRATQARQQLQASGLPVQAIYIETADGGKNVLLVIIEYDKLTLSASPGAFITAGVQSLIKVAGVKALDLSDIADITVALRDNKDRIFFSSCASTTSVDSFRKGQITQAQFLSKIAFKVEDRFAAWNAKNRKSK